MKKQRLEDLMIRKRISWKAFMVYKSNRINNDHPIPSSFISSARYPSIGFKSLCSAHCVCGNEVQNKSSIFIFPYLEAAEHAKKVFFQLRQK